MAADFNLSAAISLQLAAGAAEKLRNEIQKGFTAPLQVDAKDAKRKIGVVKKDLANDPIKVPITFVNKSAKDQYADIKKSIKPLPIDVKFSSKSVKSELTQSKLTELMGSRKLTIPVDVVYGKNTKATLDKITKQTNALIKEQKRLQDLVDAAGEGQDVVTTPTKSKKNDVKDTINQVSELFEQTKRLTTLNNQVFGGSKSFGGGFFQFATKEINGLIKELNKLSGGTKGLDLLEQKFKGLNGDSRGNALKSLEVIFKTYTALDAQTKRLQETNKKFGGSLDISKQLDQIEEARSAISKLFLAFDSANPSTFGTSVSAEFQKVKDSVIGAEREIRSYSGFLSNLNQKKAGVTAGAGRQQTIDNIDALIKEVEAQKSAGRNTDQIKSSAAFQKLNAVLGVLKYVDIAAQRAGSAIDSAVSKIGKGELKNTFGGGAVGLEKGVRKSQREANKALSSTTDPREIERIKTEALQTQNELRQRADNIQKQFQRLRGEIIKLEAANLDGPAKTLRGFISELYSLGKAGASIDQIDVAVSKKLAEVTNVKGLDKKVETAINQIARLRHALEFSPTTDNAGAKKVLDQLEADLKARVGKFKDLTSDKVTQGVSAGLFDVRALQRFNEAAETTSQKLRNIGEANENLDVGRIYSKNADEFDKAAQKIASGAGTIGQKLQDLKRLTDETLIKSKFDAEGGFFGSVAKSAGLATKRLAAFLIMAQGLYSVQSLLSASFQEAIKIDREFIKLEQVFNKEFSGTALEKSLSNVKSQIFSLGKELGVAANGVADAAQILAQAGVAGKDLEVILATVAKSELGPSFGKSAETAEAAIAIFRQFNLTAKQTEAALGGINRISAKYAVEAKGITEAVRRAGGIFSSSGDDIGQFAAAFTLVKQQTREADEAIATGLRNVAQRLQSSTVQDKLKEALGIDLVQNGEFVGFQESIQKIGQALNDLGASEKSPLFAQIREIIGGARQGGRITPLLQDFAKFGELTEEFKSGAKSIDEDVAVAFKSIENKIQRAKTAVTDLFHEIVSSDLSKFLVEAFVQITTFATNMLKVLNSVPGAILAIGTAAQVIGKSGFVGRAILSQIIPKTTLFSPKNKGGVIGLNSGGDGLIPGRGPNKDSLLAYLTKGEYVIKRGSVDKYGKSFLDRINDGSLPANGGGIIRRNKGGGTDSARVLQGKIALLQGKAAQQGSSVDPSMLKEIGDLKSELVKLNKSVTGLSISTDNVSKTYDTSNVNTGAGGPKDAYASFRRNKSATSLIPPPSEISAKFPYSGPALSSSDSAYIGNSKSISTSQSSKGFTGLLPKGALLSFGKELVTTKGGIISLVTAFAVLQGVLGQFSQGLTGLVTAMASAAFSMYALSSVGGQISGGVGKLGVAGKSIIAGKGKILAGQFAGSAEGKGKALRAAYLKTIRTAPGVGPKLDTLGNVLSTKDILAAAGRSGAIGAGTAGAVRSTASVAAQKSAQGGIAGLLTKTSGFAKNAAGFAKGLNLGAIAFGLVTGALTYFADTAEKSADLAIENAKTLEEAQQAGSKKRLAGVSGKAISKIGTIGTGVVTGAAIGSVVPILGPAVGAVVGGLAGGMIAFSSSIGKVFKNTLPSVLVSFGSVLSSGLSDFAKKIVQYLSDAAFVASENLKNGSVKDIALSLPPLTSTGIGVAVAKRAVGASKETYGDKKLATAKDQEARAFRINQTKNKLSEKARKDTQSPLQQQDFNDLAVQGLKSKGILDTVKKSKYNEKTGAIERGTFKDQAPEAQDAIRKDLQGIADVFNASGPKNQALISKMYEDIGVDIVSLAAEVEVTLNKTQAEAAAAFQKLDLFFADMAKNVEFASAKASGLEAGLSFYGSGASSSSQAFAPSQLLDILGQGIDPATLGNGQQFDQSLRNTGALAQAFDPRLAAAADFDIRGKRAARNASSAINKAGQGISIKSTNAADIESFLSNSFAAASGGDEDLGKKFNEFLKTKVETIGEVINQDGDVNATVISDLFKEFGDKFSSGALEEIKRINELAKQYSEQYKQQLAERFALENEAIGLYQSNVSKQKSIGDLSNKARGLTGDALAAAEGRQSAQSTFGTQQALLTGTGFGGGANVQQLQAGLLASQQRQRNAGSIAAQEGGGIAAITTRTAEIEAVEAERQNRLKAGLQYIASGTDNATYAMAEFERASQKAATSSKNLSDALLGSDSQMAETILGIQALDKVQAAFAKGGVGAAQATLSTFSEDARQALGNRVNSDPALQSQFNNAVGIGSNISAGPEAANANAFIREQIDANNALVIGLADLDTALQSNTGNLQKIFEAQFNNTQQVIQQAENTAKNLVAQIASLPEVIKHEGNFNINIVGGDIFNALDPAINKIVVAQIQAHLDDFADGLVANNAGLNRPPQ